VTYNLDNLKQELLDYIVSEGFAIFRGQPGSTEGHPRVYWDTENYPAYQAFLNVAKAADVKIIVLAHREFQADEIDDILEQLPDCELGRDEQRSMERSLTELRAFVGSTCSLELAFDYQGRMYAYDLATDWFQTFIDLSELVIAASTSEGDNDDEGSDSSFGGYYSKN
jgi:hypothetical protein